jgi:nucleoid-associated protein YgaU
VKTSYLISLIFGAVVLVGGGVAVVYLGGGEQTGGQSESSQVSSEQDASEPAAEQDTSDQSSASQETQAAESETSAAGSDQTSGGDSAGAQSETSASGTSATSESAAAESEDGAGQTQTASVPQDGGGAEEGAAEPEPYAPIAPSFDVVRVEPGGETVLAGRAEPNAEVTILDNGEPLGTVTADERGEWVFLPDAPLPPGSRELSLEAEDKNGLKVPSEDVVVMSVPERGERQTASGEGAEDEATQEESEQPIAVLQPREGGGASEVLQAPQGEGIAEGDLVLEAVDYGDDGEITVSGRAGLDSTIRLYLDNELVGETTPNEEGRWSYTLAERVPYGVYQLRADQVDDSGEVLARVETPFSRVEFARAELPDERFVIVQPGNSLWRIARGTLGAGVQYTVIYEANADQIRDPDLIYPGQIFAVPQTN